MGKADIETNTYLQDDARFADVFNFTIYGGEKVISPNELLPANTNDAIALRGAGGTSYAQRHRDNARRWLAKRDGRATYALLCIERQTDVHYAMPLRNMLYDALSYDGQLKRLVRKHGRPKNRHFLTGLNEGDRLDPVVTLVLHFGAEPWDGPTRVHEMLGPADGRLMALVPDYRINLVSPASMAEGDFDRFSTDLGIVLKYVKYSNDKGELARVVEGDGRFRSVGVEAVRLINALTSSGLRIGEGEETVDMCEAIRGMREDSLNEGIRLGRDEGIRLGRDEGIRLGRDEGALIALASLVRDGLLAVDVAAARAGLTVADFEEKAFGLA